MGLLANSENKVIYDSIMKHLDNRPLKTINLMAPAENFYSTEKMKDLVEGRIKYIVSDNINSIAGENVEFAQIL